MTTEMVEFSKMNPAQRLASIRTGLDVCEITMLLFYVPYTMFFSGVAVRAK
jgi:hypothetical protein